MQSSSNFSAHSSLHKVSARDPRYVKLILAIFPVLQKVFRIEFVDLHNLPDEPCLLVANHSIGALIEVLALAYLGEKRFGSKNNHSIYGLAHRFIFRFPGLSTFFTGIGAVQADYKTAAQVLEAKQTLGIFPGGNWESMRPYSERNKCDFGHKMGWIRVAKSAQKTIVPVSIHGSHSTNPVLFRSRFLAKILLLESTLAIKWFPITLGQILWSSLFLAVFSNLFSTLPLLIGVILVFIFTPYVPIFPARITIRFCEPVNPNLSEAHIYEEVSHSINSALEAQRLAHLSS